MSNQTMPEEYRWLGEYYTPQTIFLQTSIPNRFREGCTHPKTDRGLIHPDDKTYVDICKNCGYVLPPRAVEI